MTHDRIVLRVGDRGEAVRWLQSALRLAGHRIAIDGIFGPRTAAACRAEGAIMDGDVVTLAGLVRLRPAMMASSPTLAQLRAMLVAIAASQIGVRETSRNRGPEVDEYVRACGLDPSGGHPWCAAFSVWCLEQVRLLAGIRRSWTRDARVAMHARHAADHGYLVTTLRPGMLAIRVSRSGRGHMGISAGGGETIEGNTDASGSREGDGVYRRVRRLEYWTHFADPLWAAMVGGVT